MTDNPQPVAADSRDCAQCGLLFSVGGGRSDRKTCSAECRADYLRAYQREYARTRKGRSGENTRRQGAHHTTLVAADALAPGDRYTLDPRGVRGWGTVGSVAVIGGLVHVRLAVGPDVAAVGDPPVEILAADRLIAVRARRNGRP